MADVGIELPKDILAYLVLFKFPPILENLKQQIMHVEKYLTVDVGFNHLTQYNNKQKAQSKIVKITPDITLLMTEQNRKRQQTDPNAM